MSRPLRVLVAAVAALAAAHLGAPAVAGAAPVAGVTVSGTVRDLAGDPIPGILVRLQVAGASSIDTLSDIDGTYEVVAPAEGTAAVSFTDLDGTAPQYATQYWPTTWSQATASWLTLDAATKPALTGIDATLPLGASISGTITDSSGTPLPGTCANAWWSVDGSRHWLGNTVAAGDGTYSIPGLGPVDVVVEHVDCFLPSTWLTSWYDSGTSDPSTATILSLTAGAAVTGVDGRLLEGASVRGTVTDRDGAPLEGICVSARYDDDSRDGMSAITASDGTYVLAPLVPGSARIEFRACGDGAYLATASPDTLELAIGVAFDDVDAVLERAGTISGTVRDAEGVPVGGICVQASDASQVAGDAVTAGDGTYVLPVQRSGSFRVQFVDCRDEPELGGRWFGGELDPATGTEVSVTVGEDTGGVDTSLDVAPPATARGVVRNLRGEPLEGVCIVVYLAHRLVLPAVTAADGSYEVPGVPSGTYAVAALQCARGDGPDVEPYVVDPATGVAYQPIWWGGGPIELIDEEDGPDPVAQGAALTTVAPGSEPEFDLCFGCDAVDATVTAIGTDGVTAEFSTPGLAGLDGAAVRTAEAPTSSLACAPQGVAAQSTTWTAAWAEGTSGPLTVTGLADDTTYTCAVGVSVAGVVIARSAAATVSLGDPASGRGSTSPAGTGPEGAARPLSFVG